MPKNGLRKDAKTNTQEPPNSWIFLLKDEILNLPESSSSEVNGTPDIVTLRHPCTKEPAIFLFSADNSTINEILTYSENRSWFIDETVKSNGSIRISTTLDPIFLVLPYLKQDCVDKAVPLEHLLEDQRYPEIYRLTKCKGLDYLHLVADKKGNHDIIAYKYNEEKTLNWLKRKAKRLSDVLKEKNVYSGNISDEHRYLRYAVGVISDYIDDDLNKKLVEYLNLPEESQQVILKRKSYTQADGEETRDVKKVKPSEETKKSVAKSLSIKSTPISKGKTNTKKPAKSSGMKSISSFFKKA